MRLFLPVFLVLALVAHLSADESNLRRDLEHTYSQWRAAIAARSLSGWKDSTALFRQVMTRNMIVSQKQQFPEALFEFPLRAPELGPLRFLKAAAKGPTATLVYFGKVDLGIPDTEVPENLLMLKFINEGGKWKFDTLRLLNLASAPEVRSALKNGGSSAMLEEPEFQPDGVAPEVPKLCGAPDHLGGLQIIAFGYTVKAKVNGFELPAVENNAEQHLIIGGLKDGENSLTMEIKQNPIAEGSDRHVEVNAVIPTRDPSKPFIRVFNWTPEGANAPANVDEKIIVNKITMRGD